jgi:hypothetical protein
MTRQLNYDRQLEIIKLVSDAIKPVVDKYCFETLSKEKVDELYKNHKLVSCVCKNF